MHKYEIIRFLILAVGIILTAWFLLPVFVTHNLNIGAATGTGIGVILLVYGLLFHRINHLILAGWKSTAGRILEIALLVICAVVIGLAVTTGVVMIRGASTPVSPGATVIVLGARVYRDRPSTAMVGRLKAAYDYLNENPESMCIVSGGQGKNEPCTESSVMYKYLVDRGIAPERIYQEDKSTDTDENMRFSAQIIQENNLNPNAAIATDGYHEYRALRYAEKAGINAGAVPAKTVWWLFPTGVVREMYGILEQWFLK